MRKIELTIKQEQEIQIDTLRFFLDICKKEDLHFFLAYGTLLGAVRNHGFIEWDDDIDLWMPRHDFNKFASVYQKYKNEKYFLQNYRTDPDTVTPEIMRICVNGTYKWPNGCEKEKFHTGLYLDIFPLDNGFGTDQDKMDLVRCTELHSKLFRSLNRNYGISIKGIVKRFRAMLIPRRKYITQLVYLIDSHKNVESDVLLSFGAAYAGLCRSCFEKSFFDSTDYVQFENLKLPIPQKYDELLRYMYGDNYMIPIVTKSYRTVAYRILKTN